MSLRYVAVHPGPFLSAAFKTEMELTMSRLMGGILVDFGKTVETWELAPSFEFEFNSNDQVIEAHVFCDALRDGDRIKGTGGFTHTPINLVYFFLNYGTRIRYATMSHDFSPKTSVRVLQSFPGSGGKAYVSIFLPRPGIKARHWDDEIKKKYEKIIESQLRSTLIRAVRNSGHAFER